MSVESDVTRAAEELVAAFARHDVAGYFGAFAPDATFIFYNHDRVLTSRAQYEALWAEWESTGFRVLACASSEPSVQVVGDDVAVFTHTVRTTVEIDGATAHTGERETIVFQRVENRWWAVHEHLSTDINFPG